MWGAIIGDIVGSRFEFNRNNIKTKDFDFFGEGCHFTDDTVLTIATAATLTNKIAFDKYVDRFRECTPEEYALAYKEFGNAYPRSGYGYFFKRWLTESELTINNSFGNGSAMRVSPIGFAFTFFDNALEEAKKSCAYTHNHEEGIKGAQAVTAAIHIALTEGSCSKNLISAYITSRFGYNLNRTLDEIRPNYSMDATCQGSVPEAIIAFLESDDFESAIRGAISIGGDSDTIAAITGSIAEAFYGTPPLWMINQASNYLDTYLLRIVHNFYLKLLDKTKNSE
jgi:ADP-ribosylglycohydrolase